MSRYSVSAGNAGTQQALTTTYKTLASLTAATGATTLRRAWLYDVMFGTDGTPADQVLSYKVDRQSTVGTGTGATPAPLDAADAAALITTTLNNTIEPTVTSATQLIEIGVNQRASYRWVAAPGGELIVPATNTNGLGFRAKSPAYTGTAMCTLHWWE
jgi:hypothetical protein